MAQSRSSLDPPPDQAPPPVLPWRPGGRRPSWPEGYWRLVLWRGLKLRCPVCGQGKLFRSYFVMSERCDRCGVGFHREHGQWVGSLDINTLLVALVLMIGVGFGPLWSIRTSLLVWGTAAVVVPLLTFRYSKGVWTAIVHLTGGIY